MIHVRLSDRAPVIDSLRFFTLLSFSVIIKMSQESNSKLTFIFFFTNYAPNKEI